MNETGEESPSLANFTITSLEDKLKTLQEKYDKDIQELNDRLVDFGKSHLVASKRDLDKYRELEKDFKKLFDLLSVMIPSYPCPAKIVFEQMKYKHNL